MIRSAFLLGGAAIALFHAASCFAFPAPTAYVFLFPKDVFVGVQTSLVANVSDDWRVVPSGRMAFSMDGLPITGCESVPITPENVDGGQATCMATFASAGSHVVQATYSGDPILTDPRSDSATFTTVTRIVPNMLVEAGDAVVLAGSGVDLSAYLFSSETVPQGTMRFLLDGQPVTGCDAVLVSGGVAQCRVDALAEGSHSFRAEYSGDDLDQPVALAWTRQAVTTPVATTVSELLPSQVTVKAGAPVTVRARSSVFSAGTFTFLLDGVVAPGCVGVRAPDLLYAPCTWADLPPGRHAIEARFDGYGAYAPASATTEVVVARTVRHALDLDGDGSTDILVKDGSGALWSILMDDMITAGARQLLPAGTGWAATMAGDFNGDGKSDLLFEHPDGSVAIWLMDGVWQVGGARLLGPGTGWKPRLIADFNGDGKSDILWEHTDGRAAIWLMSGATQVGGALLLPAGTGWHAKASGDFDGDGRGDILWTHDDQSAAIWLMNGVRQAGGGRILGPGTGWTPTLLEDFDGDGLADVAWSHADGRVAVWIMRGATQVGGGLALAAGTGYSVVGAADFTGDGRADFILAKPDMTAAIVPMQGGAAGALQLLYPSYYQYGLLGVSPGDRKRVIRSSRPEMVRFSSLVYASVYGTYGLMVPAAPDPSAWARIGPNDRPPNFTPVVIPAW